MDRGLRAKRGKSPPLNNAGVGGASAAVIGSGVAGVGSNLIIMIIMIMVKIMVMMMTTNATTHHQGATRGKGRQRAGRSQRVPVKTRADLLPNTLLLRLFFPNSVSLVKG